MVCSPHQYIVQEIAAGPYVSGYQENGSQLLYQAQTENSFQDTYLNVPETTEPYFGMSETVTIPLYQNNNNYETVAAAVPEMIIAPPIRQPNFNGIPAETTTTKMPYLDLGPVIDPGVGKEMTTMPNIPIFNDYGLPLFYDVGAIEMQQEAGETEEQEQAGEEMPEQKKPNQRREELAKLIHQEIGELQHLTNREVLYQHV